MVLVLLSSLLAISIHVLREEDDGLPGLNRQGCPISIHVLREEDDRCRRLRGAEKMEFQSTSSARRTTAKVHKKPVHLLHKRYNHFPAGQRNPPYSGKTKASTFNSLAIKC